MIEAPVKIDDEYVRKYLWEHNLVAIDEGDLRKLMPPKPTLGKYFLPEVAVKAAEESPKKLMLIPALMEQAGWVRKKEWVGLTDKEKNAITWGKTVYEILDLAEAKLREKNA